MIDRFSYFNITVLVFVNYLASHLVSSKVVGCECNHPEYIKSLINLIFNGLCVIRRLNVDNSDSLISWNRIIIHWILENTLIQTVQLCIMNMSIEIQLCTSYIFYKLILIAISKIFNICLYFWLKNQYHLWNLLLNVSLYYYY